MNTRPRYLAGLVDLPYVTPQGRLVTRPGYDPETCLYLDAPHDMPFEVPDSPTADQVRAAVMTMMGPWRAYGFASDDCAAGMVSGVIAAVVRPVLDLCPAYLFDASQQGSGKTRAACALGSVVTGQRPAVTPFAGTSTDDELRKRLGAGAVDGDRFQCLDNITGFFKSSVMAAVLTSGKLTDRFLGQSRMVTANVRSLLTMTGNNASIDADLQRRTVQVRIDAGANPTHRAFDFCPVSEALAQRRAIAEAVCTVLMGYFSAGAPNIIKGDAGGFAEFNRLCRQPVLWLAREGLADGLPWQLGDGTASMLADASVSDPDLEATGDLLKYLWLITQGDDFTAAQAVKWHEMGQSAKEARDEDSPFWQLRSAVLECVGRADLNARSMGRVLLNRRDRVTHGVGGSWKLLTRTAGGPMRSWRVVRAD